MNISYSNHVAARIQQRGMRGKDIEMVIEVGTIIDDSVVLLDKDVEREIKKRKREIEMLGRLRSVRVVLGEGETVITAYHLDRKIEKHLLRGSYKYKSKRIHSVN